MRKIITPLSQALTICAVLAAANLSQAQDDFVYWPDADYDPAIPTFEQVLGYQPGERITWHRDAIRYFKALAEAAPQRMRITEWHAAAGRSCCHR